MAALITWCRLMRTGPVCAIPCDDCRATSGKLARAGITIDPDRFYNAPPTSEETDMTDRITFEVTKDGWTGGAQLSISQTDENGLGDGYRLAGPKFNGSSKSLLTHEVTQEDADEIRKYLDKAFPVTLWTGYDDEERSFPAFATKAAAQAYAEHRYREDCRNWNIDADDLEIAWSERKAYTDAHDGRAGMFDLVTEVGSDGYVVHELTVHTRASDAIREDQKREAGK